jgi:hypothetical protein
MAESISGRGTFLPVIVHDGHGTHFNDRVLDYGTNPCNHGSLANPDGHAKYRGPCGDTV